MMKLFRVIFNFTQLKKFLGALTSFFVRLFTNLTTYGADIFYASAGRLSPRAAFSNEELVGVHPISVFIKNYFLLFYYSFLLLFAVDYHGWQFFLVCALFAELFILFLGCYIRGFWLARSVIIGLVAGVWILSYSSAPMTDSYPDYVALVILSKITLSSFDFWSQFYTSVTAAHNIFIYFYYHFLTLYLPFYLACLIIFLPLLSAITLLSAGYLLGYVLAGRLATALIFISSLSTYYILFFYEYGRAYILSHYGQGVGDFVMEVSCGTGGVTNKLHFFPTADLERSLIQPLKDPAFTAMKDAHDLNIWLDFGSFIGAPFFSINFEFVLDSISLIMVVTITTISFIVHLYATVYMRSDPHQVRFFALLSLFTFFMIVLVMGGNMVMLYIGWEGVGLSSFLLISFWFTRVAAQKAALKAMLVNKIGDMALIVALSFLAYFAKGSVNILVAPELAAEAAMRARFPCGFTGVDVIAFALLLAAFVKSAQIFFHTWLADAMEGPTPVSALLHAATMVTAGVYLVARFSYVFEFSPSARSFIFCGGLATIVVSSLIALAQYDIKKIIAYSTCSQLGLMFMACGMSAYDFALFHFFNHAFFKCLLFLLAGAIIHQLRNEQDIRKMGGLAAKMPFTFAFFLIASFSLAGLPGCSGALSKDAILHLANFTAATCASWGASICLFSLNGIIYLTVAYTGRLVYYVFLGPANYNPRYFAANYRDVSIAERPYAAIFTVLAFMSIFGGRLAAPLFNDSSTAGLINVHNHLVINNTYYHLLPTDRLFSYVAFFFTWHAIFLAAYLIYFLQTNKPLVIFVPHNKLAYGLFCFFNRKCYFDDVYNIFIIRPILRLSHTFNFAIENGVFRQFASSLWAVLLLPLRTRLTTMRMALIHHFFFTAIGLILFIIFSHIMSLQ
jgi:proton-translocating NADH-quinone oxidoreductase chain L